jgi:hypothetical protein
MSTLDPDKLPIGKDAQSLTQQEFLTLLAAKEHHATGLPVTGITWARNR